MNRKVLSKTLTKLTGFKKIGSFYIGICNENVIAGYGVDMAPSAVHIWRFALPSYDDLVFLHFSLGKRILAVDETMDPKVLLDFIQNDWLSFSSVTDCKSLIDYIEVEKFEGTYPSWVRYLTHIREKEFSEAERIYTDVHAIKAFSALPVISKQFSALRAARETEGWSGCFMLLDAWQQKTKIAYCASVAS